MPIFSKKKEFTGWDNTPVVPYKTIWENEGLKDFVQEALMKPATVQKDHVRAMKMYTVVYDFVNTEGADICGLQQALYFAMLDRAAALQQKCRSSGSTVELFATFLAGWRMWKQSSHVIHFVFHSIDVIWIPILKTSNLVKAMESSNPTMTIEQLFSDLWRSSVAVPLSLQIVNLAMELLRQEHNGDTQNSAGLTACMSCFTRELNYESVAKKFETQYMEETEKYYSEVMNKLRMQGDEQAYVRMVTEVFDREVQTAKLRLRDCVLERFNLMLDRIFLYDNENLFRSMFIPSLRRDDVDEIRVVYHAMMRAYSLKKSERPTDPIFTPLRNNSTPKQDACKLFRRYVRSKIQQFIDEDAAVSASKGIDSNERFAEVLLQHYAHFSMIIQNAFDDDSEFRESLELMMSEILNSINSDDKGSGEDSLTNVAIALARYCDKTLRKRKHPLTSDEVEARQRGVVTLLNRFSAKDMFIKQYEKFFAQRVFSQSSIGAKEEAEMAVKLSSSQGSSYVSHLMTMIRDCNSNSEIMTSFHNSKVGSGVPLEAMAVNASTWPISSANHPSVTLPSNVTQWLNAFDKFYCGKYHDRKVEHMHHLARAEVRYNINDSRSVMLILSAYQVSMLSLFARSSTTIELGEMVKRCSIPKVIVRRQVKPLIIHGLLNTSDYTLSSDETKLSLNPDFSLPEGQEQQSMLIDPKDDFRLKEMSKKRAELAGPSSSPVSGAANADSSAVPQASEQDGAGEDGLLSDKTLEEMVEKERQAVLQAAIMRTLKRAKTMNIKELNDTVSGILASSFQVTQPMLKTAIATLKQLGFIDFAQSTGTVDYIP